MLKVLVTGAAGFIGFHVCKRLQAEGYHVTGVDNVNNYYSFLYKEQRLRRLFNLPNYEFCKIDLADIPNVRELFNQGKFHAVIHLAAQAGVRYSMENPQAYIDSNITGFLNVLEGCRHFNVRHLLYASSSSVYGLQSRETPCSEDDDTDCPMSLYAATKRANELMAHSYAHLYGINICGLRFFTVYGPWGRPDSAIFKFMKAMTQKQTFLLYNGGDMDRDFTYIDDVVESVFRLLKRSFSNDLPYAFTERVFNIGGSRPVKVSHLVDLLQMHSQIEAMYVSSPMHKADITYSCADNSRLEGITEFVPQVTIDEGVKRFVEWYMKEIRDNLRNYKLEDA